MRQALQRHLQAPSHPAVGQSWIPSFKENLKTVCVIMQSSLLYVLYSAYTSFVLEAAITLIES